MHLEVLSHHPLFGTLSDSDLRDLGRAARTRHYARGEPVFLAGDAGSSMYVVLSGKVSLRRTAADGRETLLGVLGTGQLFGELAAIDPAPRSATASALTDTLTLIEIDRPDLLAWLDDRPRFTIALLTQIAGRLRHATDVVGDLMFIDVAGRVVKALLALAEQFGNPTDGGVRVQHDLTQEELAKLVGASRETVNKVLAELAHQGCIRVEPRVVVIADIAELERRG